jgi:hypothetical protein
VLCSRPFQYEVKGRDFCESEPKVTNGVTGGFNWNSINGIRESDGGMEPGKSHN